MSVQEMVDALDDTHFTAAAVTAAEQLQPPIGAAFVRLEPGDGTSYRITIVRPQEIGVVGHTVFTDDPHDVYGWRPIDRYFVATQFGPLYEMNPMGGYDWGYVADHWLPDMKASQEWTARVLARFLNTLCAAMKENDGNAG